MNQIRSSKSVVVRFIIPDGKFMKFNKTYSALILFAGLHLISPLSKADNYTFTDINHPNATSSTFQVGGTFVSDINNFGQAVGTYWNNNVYGYGFVYNSSQNSFSTINYPMFPEGSLYTNVTESFGINDTGKVAGVILPSTGQASNYLYNANESSFSVLPIDPNGQIPGEGGRPWSAQARDINNSGQIVGNYRTLEESESRLYIQWWSI
ncbi:hypothetical protein [Methylomonas methanica]|uniref:hypothetical protein n=1 Tax=Methylomonas methanica TaxID=421 RepID=UPI0012F6A321|nr:hypothetical protein [Methylomonas methanica]